MKKPENISINKKRLEIRLDPETSELIDSLIARTQLTKSSLIKNALKVYASGLKNGHIYTIRLKQEKLLIDEPTEEWDKMIDELEK